MFSTSKDILSLTLAVSIAALTGFLCWVLYYLIAALRDIRHITGSIRERFDAIWDFLNHTKAKMETTATAATAVSQAAIEVVRYVKEKKAKKIKMQKSKIKM
jgi:hypothetical protein